MGNPMKSPINGGLSLSMSICWRVADEATKTNMIYIGFVIFIIFCFRRRTLGLNHPHRNGVSSAPFLFPSNLQKSGGKNWTLHAAEILNFAAENAEIDHQKSWFSVAKTAKRSLSLQKNTISPSMQEGFPGCRRCRNPPTGPTDIYPPENLVIWVTNQLFLP